MAKNPVLITPSILACDLTHLQDEVDSIEQHADWLQVDVMDGHFVPNLSFGAPVIKHIKTKLPLDIHLMVSNPHDRVEEFIKAGAKHITFHTETVSGSADRHHLIHHIRNGGATAGVALNPGTPLSAIEDIVGEIDLALIMSVHPGFSGQTFMPEVLDKVMTLRKAHPDLMIQMDGGINAETAAFCKNAGANNLVVASFIFGSKDRAAAIAQLRAA